MAQSVSIFKIILAFPISNMIMPNLSFFVGKCFIKLTNGHLLHRNVWVPLKLGALGFQKLGLIEMQFNSNQIYLSIYASHVVKADKQKGQKLEEYIEVEVH